MSTLPTLLLALFLCTFLLCFVAALFLLTTALRALAGWSGSPTRPTDRSSHRPHTWRVIDQARYHVDNTPQYPHLPD